MIQFKYLEKGQILATNRRVEIQMIAGEAWVTLEGDPTDYVLTRNQKFRGQDEKLLVIEALQNSTFFYSEQTCELNFGVQEKGSSAAACSYPEGLASARFAGDQEQF